MAKLYLADLRKLDLVGLETKLSELNMELMKEKLQSSMGGASKSPGHLKSLKKTVAKIKLILAEKRRP